MGCPDVRGQWLVYCYCLPQTRGRLPPPKKILGTGGPPDVSRGPGAQNFSRAGGARCHHTRARRRVPVSSRNRSAGFGHSSQPLVMSYGAIA